MAAKKFRPNAAQRDGAVAPAHLRVTLSNGVVVERKGKNSSLTVTDPTGRRSGPAAAERFCRAAGPSIRPASWRPATRKKADILLRIIGIGNELHLRDMEIKSIYDKRTFTGQLAQQKKHFADELISYPDAPEQPLSASDLIRRQQDILARNGENQRKRSQLSQLEIKSRTLAQRREQLEAELAHLTEEQAALTTDLYAARKSAEDLQDESTAELEASIQSIEETNRKVRANLEKARAEDEASKYASDYDKLTDAIEQKRKERLALLNGADLPAGAERGGRRSYL